MTTQEEDNLLRALHRIADQLEYISETLTGIQMDGIDCNLSSENEEG